MGFWTAVSLGSLIRNLVYLIIWLIKGIYLNKFKFYFNYNLIQTIIIVFYFNRYDVWVTNNRGNRYSFQHKTLNISNKIDKYHTKYILPNVTFKDD